jgi:DhnA family fructose-bisphosphate aldolase class Ia
MTGKRVRLARLFRDDGRSVVIALDHGQFKGTMRGIENLSSTVQRVVDGGADAVILNPGALERATAACVGRCGSNSAVLLFCALSAASTARRKKTSWHRTALFLSVGTRW